MAVSARPLSPNVEDLAAVKPLFPSLPTNGAGDSKRPWVLPGGWRAGDCVRYRSVKGQTVLNPRTLQPKPAWPARSRDHAPAPAWPGNKWSHRRAWKRSSTTATPSVQLPTSSITHPGSCCVRYLPSHGRRNQCMRSREPGGLPATCNATPSQQPQPRSEILCSQPPLPPCMIAVSTACTVRRSARETHAVARD